MRGDLLNLLLYGPPDTGKIFTILASVRKRYGPALPCFPLLELSASEKRRVAVVHHKIKTSAKPRLLRPTHPLLLPNFLQKTCDLYGEGMLCFLRAPHLRPAGSHVL